MTQHKCTNTQRFLLYTSHVGHVFPLLGNDYMHACSCTISCGLQGPQHSQTSIDTAHLEHPCAVDTRGFAFLEDTCVTEGLLAS